MATESILECNCKDAYLTEGFKFVEEKRGSVKVENDGQVHDLIDQKFFLIQTLLKRLFSYDTKIDLGTQSITVDRVFNGAKNLMYIHLGLSSVVTNSYSAPSTSGTIQRGADLPPTKLKQQQQQQQQKTKTKKQKNKKMCSSYSISC